MGVQGYVRTGRFGVADQRSLTDAVPWLAPLAVVVLLGLVLRVHRLDAASLWVDELFTLHWAERSFGFLWTEGWVLEPNPPLYYSLVKAWLLLLGHADGPAVRAFSALASTATIPVVALIGCEAGGRRVGLLAALLFALAPVQIHYAQEARTYALLIFCVAVAMLGLLRFALAARAGRPGWKSLALYAGGAIGMVYSHASAVIVLAALNLCCLVWVLLQPRWRAPLGALVAANVALALAAVPQLLVMLVYMQRTHEIAFIQPFGLVPLLNLSNTLLTEPATALLHFRTASIVSAALCALIGLVLLTARPGRLPLLLLVGVPVLFLALGLLIGLRVPFLMPRIVTWMSVPLCVLLAVLLLSPHAPAALRVALAATLAGSIAIGLHGVYRLTPEVKEDWRGAAAELQRRVAPGDLVVFGPESVAPGIEHYGGLGAEPLRWRPAAAPYRPIMQLQAPLPRFETEDLVQALAAGRRVHLLLRRRDWTEHGKEALAATAAHPPPAERHLAQLVLLTW